MRYILAFWLAVALIPSIASAYPPSPNLGHATGTYRGTGAVHQLPFGHVSDGTRSGAYYVPSKQPAAGYPVLVLFHGYGDDGRNILNRFRDAADRHGVAVIAPDSLAKAWGVGIAGVVTPDLLHAVDASYWLRSKLTAIDRPRCAAAGHSYGTRMTAYFATVMDNTHAAAISHGRYLPVSLGKSPVDAFFSGSPRDNWFDFRVMQAQWKLWPRGLTQLHTYDCPTCMHPVQPPEIEDMIKWIATRN